MESQAEGRAGFSSAVYNCPHCQAEIVEPRRTLWINYPFPATVRGLDEDGRTFEERTRLDNLSARELQLRLRRHIEIGARLFVVIRLSTAPNEEPVLHLAVRGVVHRLEAQTDGTCGVAIMFHQHRFI